MDEQLIPCSDAEYLKDIEEVRMGSLSEDEEDEDDDDDEPRLCIDTSEDDSPESMYSRSLDMRGLDDLVKNQHFPTKAEKKNNNPLQSLQQMVHSPFLTTISVTDGDVQGCNEVSLIPERSSKWSDSRGTVTCVRQGPADYDMAQLRPTFRKQSSCISVLPPMDVSLTPLVSVEMDTKRTEDTVRPEKLKHVLKKLENSAMEETHMRQLQRMAMGRKDSKDYLKFKKFLNYCNFGHRMVANNVGVYQANPNTYIDVKRLMNSRPSGASRNTHHMSITQRNVAPLNMNIRMPPALTVIPKIGGNVTKKNNCRRSPPPMVPIDSLINFRKTTNYDDNVFNKLKKLGTVIELEKAPSNVAQDEVPEVSVDRIPKPVTNNDKVMPCLKPFANLEWSSVSDFHKLVPRTAPPPSLIPIKPRYVPILPNINANSKPEISFLPRKNLTQATKRKRRNRLSREYTKLAHALVLPASSIIREVKESIPNVPSIPVEVIIETTKEKEREPEPEPKPELEPAPVQTPVPEPPIIPAPAPENKDEKTKTIETEAQTSAGSDSVGGSGETVQPDQSKKYFVFQTSHAIQVDVLPNGRKMLSCDICSGVYHKMFSLRKHYYRNHINPKFISEKVAAVFQVSLNTEMLAGNPKVNSAVYWCGICGCLFDEKSDLSSHLTDHPPSEDIKNSPLYSCEICKMAFPKKRTQDRHQKKCAKLNRNRFRKNKSPEQANAKVTSEEKIEESKNWKLETSDKCLFCELPFPDSTKKKKHVLQNHHPKRKQQLCVYCKDQNSADLGDLFKHICETHGDVNFGCAPCKIRFNTKEDLATHTADAHNFTAKEEVKDKNDDKKQPLVANKNGRNFKCNVCPKVFSNTVELGKHRKTAHREVKSNFKKVVAVFNVPEEQKYRSTIITTADYETEFYKNVSANVKFNLENCLDGRVEPKKDGQVGEPADCYIEPIVDETPEPLNFQSLYKTDNIDSKFIQNVSRLDLFTQLTILRKANLLDAENETDDVVNIDKSSIASRLALAKKIECEENPKNDDGEQKSEASEDIFGGEWIRPRVYICDACFARFNDFWDMENHRWSKHPNVWSSYYEFLTEQDPGVNWGMQRSLKRHGCLASTPAPKKLPIPTTCTKCKKVFGVVAELHKHILECAGDTSWTSMLHTNHTKRNKKWRPFGSKRRRNIARHRGLKRNIPTTPVKIVGPTRNRQKAGDTETIQRMIANLPPKRITRRVITFDDIDTKKNRVNNGQANMLTRKRKENLEVKAGPSNVKVHGVKSAEPKQMTNKHPRGVAIKTQTSFDIVSKLDNVKTTETHGTSDNNVAKKAESKIIAKTALESGTKIKTEIDGIISKTPDTRGKTKTDNEKPRIESEAGIASKSNDDESKSKMPSAKKTSRNVENKSPVLEELKCDDLSLSKGNSQERNSDEMEIVAVQTESICEKPDLRSAVNKNMEAGKKPLIIKFQSEKNNVENKSTACDKPVTIIRSDKKKKKRCSPIGLRNAAESATKESNLNGRRNSVIIEMKSKIKKEPDVKDEPKSEVQPVESEAESVTKSPSQVKVEIEELSKNIEAEEGEIDLEAVIEPADEDSPTLPDTSEILAAMKETMSQTDTVITSLPISPNSGKKRTRECKKNSVKDVETSVETNKNTKDKQSDCFNCKVCRSVVVSKIRNDETCEKCLMNQKKFKKLKIKEKIPLQQFRCRKCEALVSAPMDGSLYCDKCTRLQETVCLLCKSSYISDTNDKVCGKCILASSSKLKKRNTDDAVVTSNVTCSSTMDSTNLYLKEIRSKGSTSCDEYGDRSSDIKTDKVAKKRRNSCPLERKLVTEVVCDTCGKTWTDKDYSGSPICHTCRQSYENNASRVTMKDKKECRIGEELPRCADCSVVKAGEVTLKKLCDGCSSKKTERRSSNENRFLEKISSQSEIRNSAQGCPASGENMQLKEIKEEANTSHTPMKNVRLICKGCFGVFDTVSSYKNHCVTCRGRTADKPQLSFSKNKTKGKGEPPAQADGNSASFEILENVQITVVKNTDQTEPGKESLPRVFCDADNLPTKKVECTKSAKKSKFLVSSVESIAESIERTIKNICYSDADVQMEEVVDSAVNEVVKVDVETQMQKNANNETKTEVEKPKKNKKSKKNKRKLGPPKLEPEVGSGSKIETNEKSNESVEMKAPRLEVFAKKRKGAKLVKREVLKNQKLNQVSVATRLRKKNKEKCAVPGRILRPRGKPQDDEVKNDPIPMEVMESNTNREDVAESSEKKSKKRKAETALKTVAKKAKEESSDDVHTSKVKENDNVEKSIEPEQSTCSRKNNAVVETSSPERKLRRRSSEQSECGATENSSPPSPSMTPNCSRRNSVIASVLSETTELMNSFLEGGPPQVACGSSTEYDEGSHGEATLSSYLQSYQREETEEDSRSNTWDFFDNVSSLTNLGVIFDEVNELLSGPEVANIAAEFQLFRNDSNESEKMEEDYKEDDETTTIMDLDQFSSSKMESEKKLKNLETEPVAGSSGINRTHHCDVCELKFTDPKELLKHISSVHPIQTLSKTVKNGKINKPTSKTQNGVKSAKYRCNHCDRILATKTERSAHMREHWNKFAGKGEAGSKLKNAMADKFEGLLLEKALANYLRCPQNPQYKNNLPLKILSEINTAKKNNFSNWKSILLNLISEQHLLMLLSKKEPPSAPAEALAMENPSNTNTESSNSETVEGYPCPMCDKTFQYTSIRNRHLIMVHAPRQSTHKHLIENNDTKKEEKKSGDNSFQNCDGSGESRREKVIQSYLLNDSVNTVLRKESNEDGGKPSEPVNQDGKRLERQIPAKSDLSSVKPKTNVNQNNIKPADGVKENDRINSKKPKPCRKKMSKKEMNIPPALVKLKAEQALLQLCNSRFNKSCPS